MLCYRDRTYCNCEDCANTKCWDRLTDDVVKAAEKWRLPVSVGDFSKLCKMKVEKNVGIQIEKKSHHR